MSTTKGPAAQMAAENSKKAKKNIDEMLAIVGEYGMFQKLVNLLLCIMTLPCIYHIMIMYFAADEPNWQCTKNSTTCVYNGTFSPKDMRRCHQMERSDWEFTKPKDYSLVTYFDIHCEEQWLLELLTSLFFVGWLLGAFGLGWVCDNYGRKIVITVSTTVVMTTGFACIYMPSIYYIIACRFIIGFFLPGTMYQAFIIISELVGAKYRAFAGQMIFVFGISGLTIIGVKAYFIDNWKALHLYCTAPYLFVVLFYKFIPESIRYLRVKGKMDELNDCFLRIARWNKTFIPSDICVSPPPKDSLDHKSNPTQLFKTKKLAIKTSIQTFAYFSTGLVYYGVYLAAGDIGGSMYRDYIIISGMEVPLIFVSMDFLERFGRKRTSTIPMLLASVACLIICFIPKHGHLKIARVVVGMIGKCMVGSNMNTMSTWSTELYTTQVRGEAMGFFQAFVRLGAAVAPWVNHEFVKIHKSASFIFLSILAMASFILLGFLPETRGIETGDAEGEECGEPVDETQLQVVVDNKTTDNERKMKGIDNTSYESSLKGGLETMD